MLLCFILISNLIFLPSSLPFLLPSFLPSFSPSFPPFLPLFSVFHQLFSSSCFLTNLFFFLYVSSPSLNSPVKGLETLPLCEPQLQPTRYTSCNLLPQYPSILFSSLHFFPLPVFRSFFLFITSRTHAHSSYLVRMHNYCSVKYLLLFFTIFKFLTK